MISCSPYIALTEADRMAMLQTIGVERVEDLFQDVPPMLRFPQLHLPLPRSEQEVRDEAERFAQLNATCRSHRMFLGAGAYAHVVPSAIDHLIRRSEFYTAYTPYQPEVSQGTLQAIFEYQSLITRLTGMDVANASHYDGGTAMAEAAIVALHVNRKRRKLVVARSVNPQYRAILRTYLQGLDVEIVGDEQHNATIADTLRLVDAHTAACIVQSPDFTGRLHDMRPIAQAVHAVGALLIMHFDPISLGLFQTPGEVGADIATAEGQPLGLGLHVGGPYLGIFACRQTWMHKMAGRVVGVTRDVDGQAAYVLTLRAREQDIRRERATSNICTNQGLMALAAAIYLSLMGKQGLRQVARLCYHRSHYAADQIATIPGYRVHRDHPFFREFVVECPHPPTEINAQLLHYRIIGGYDLSHEEPHLKHPMLVCVTEMNSKRDIDEFVQALREIGR